MLSGDVVYDGDLFDAVYHSEPEVYRRCRSSQDHQPLPGRVFASEQPPHDQDTEEIPGEMVQIAMYEVAGDQPPCLASEDRGAVITPGREVGGRNRVDQRQDHDDQHGPAPGPMPQLRHQF